jgi:Helicase conserved C-terminal domain
MWRRLPAVQPDAAITVGHAELMSRRVITRDLPMPDSSPMKLRVQIYPRKIPDRDRAWLVTIVLRNSTENHGDHDREAVLYQTFFEVMARGGRFEPYPESPRPLERLDQDEQSLALLYRDSATWAIGHGCAAGWDAALGTTPKTIYADVMPAVELPSMTPNIEVNGNPLQLSMRELAALPEEGTGAAWNSLDELATGYEAWINARRNDVVQLAPVLRPVAQRHLDACTTCLTRIKSGIDLLRQDTRVRKAFRLSNLAMLLQQIGTKQQLRRPLVWDAERQRVVPRGPYRTPSDVYEAAGEQRPLIGSWRAFQIAFLVMSLNGVQDGPSAEREVVDLIWFPTGGGKTEAYLGVVAFYLFHQRLLMADNPSAMQRDGTNVLMRYTLRMLTTQQFQRAASLICAMEYLRRNYARHGTGPIPGKRFSLGLWLGAEGSPNSIKDARAQLAEFRRGDIAGNPLVLTECPWCRSEIGRFSGSRPTSISKQQWNALVTRGINDDETQGPLLSCPDAQCEFGRERPETWLPVEVIDERIYAYPPSLVIATVDKLAMLAHRPAAGSLLGRRLIGDVVQQVNRPPGVIIQDELHLISGPLGTMYALYEGIFERLCSVQLEGRLLKPKLIASTATIRGAGNQVRSLYARTSTHLFPCPALLMDDSFFGRYARDSEGNLQSGRLYLGIHATDYGSVLTTQVRTFSSVLFRPWSFAEEARDPWWTLLAFYNSIRELGGAKTLFDSDIRSRLKFIFNREGFDPANRRTLRIVEELTSRLTQAEIVQMMDRLAEPLTRSSTDSLDACLASSIIEVGVDIDRLSLMGIIGQPKTTSTYIQVTGRVGRRWWDRPGLILVIYNPSKSRDRSHFEQFHSYHRRLYERVEPTTATPFAISAMQRGLAGALLSWARQQSRAAVQNPAPYIQPVEDAAELLRTRCVEVQQPADQARSLAELERLLRELLAKWRLNPQLWEEFPQKITGEYLMLWPGQYATPLQRDRGVTVPSSMRQVDSTAELEITQGYAAAAARATQGNPTGTP